MPKNKSTLTRSIECELRANNRDDGQEQGIIEGYFARWDQVDSHNTMFQRGCFSKSIQERSNKIVVRNSHGNPIGKPLEIREDDIGAYFVGQLDLDVQEAREAFSLVKNEIVTGLSFGFRSVHDKIGKGGVRTFTEVMLLEISPTWLPSGDDSRITQVRSGDSEVEERGTTLAQTMTENMSYVLWNSIQETISDIWWSWSFGDINESETMALIDQALSDFRDQYVEFAADWIRNFASSMDEEFVNTFMGEGERQQDDDEDDEDKDDDRFRASPVGQLQTAMSIYLSSRSQKGKDFIDTTGINADDFESLRRGKHLADLEASGKLPQELRTLNNSLRAAQFEDLFTTLRTRMSKGEMIRSNALLSVCNKVDEPETRKQEEEIDTRSILDALQNINRK